ncbi:hypothetical protein [Mycobacterium sp. OAE908]|uniref:hypothetical protein n=1 Tax=Mycobacterium sp. OAE908 TaxID=2817899 RepID=UPI001AE26660
MSEVSMTDDGEVRYESVFRERWRDRQSGGARPGELIKQPGWIDAGLAALGVLLVAGAVVAGTVTVARSESLPAAVQGNSVIAVLPAVNRGPAPAQGSAVQFRTPSGATYDAVVVDVGATEVVAQLKQPGPESTGQLLVPTGRQRLITVLLPRLW